MKGSWMPEEGGGEEEERGLPGGGLLGGKKEEPMEVSVCTAQQRDGNMRRVESLV
jgi:hypothetical protein